MLTRSHRFRWTHILGCVVMLALVLALTGQTFAAEDTAETAGQRRGAIEIRCDLAGRLRRLDRRPGAGLLVLQVGASTPIRATSG